MGAAFATGLRWAVGHHLPPGFPFLTYFPVVIITAFVVGARTGAITAILSGLAAWYWFIPPAGFKIDDATGVAMLFYAFITATEVMLVHFMQRANRQALAEREANGRLAETQTLLFRELQHRVSNNLQMVAALLNLQRRQLKDADARDALNEAARRLGVVGRISRKLYDPAGASQPLTGFLDELARDVIQSNASAMPVTHEVSGDMLASIPPEAAIPVALVVAEAIANAIEHGFVGRDNGRIDIRIAQSADRHLTVEIEDDGRGLPAGFSMDDSDSLGLRLASMLAGQLGGRFSLERGAVQGTLARIELPLGG
jgi:two-component sensor histidine kinase